MSGVGRVGTLFLCVLCVIWVLKAGTAPARESGLQLVLEVRDNIHREYVDELDSMRIIDAGLDGLGRTPSPCL